MNLTLLAIGFLLTASPTQSDAFTKAYKDESQMLQKEKAGLEKRLSTFRKEEGADLQTLRDELVSLSEQLSELRIKNELSEERLILENESADSADRSEQALASVLEQALATSPALVVDGEEIEESVEGAEVLLGVLKQTLLALENENGIREDDGQYYDRDGVLREGRILKIGKLSALALNTSTPGLLLPTADGHYEVARSAEGPELATWLKGTGPQTPELLLFDPLEKGGAVISEKRTLLDDFTAGGVVMWPLLILGIIAILILIERVLSLSRVHTNTTRLMQKVGAHMADGEWSQATDACRKRPGSVSRVLETILRNRNLVRDQLEDLTEEAILAERPRLERFLPALNVIAAVSPLLGLLGTVTGMIATFVVITEYGTGDPRLLSGGISEALLTTQFGLAVAIPTLLIHSTLAGRVDHILGDMEAQALRVLNAIAIRSDQPVRLVKEEKGGDVAGGGAAEGARLRELP